ncbi:MAG TPA: endolytic transglycosylase MltG [Candidatus Limivicinus faecipullorum]|nr:endolytic transglycosylase MltG [Candidatus Limivicinus faecipullorum]
MPGDIDKINEIFRIHDKAINSEDQAEKKETEKTKPKKKRAVKETLKELRSPVKAMDKLLTDDSGHGPSNYTGDEESERDYHPVRQSHEYHSGCMGGIMYFVFIACVSVVLACLAWMAASDMLALNKDEFTAVVTLPMSIFSSETVDTYDEEGNKTGTERVTYADMDYVTDALKEAGLIEYKWLFNVFCKISTASEKVSPGEYELKSTFDYRALIQNMRAGSASTVTVDVTLPEGFTMRQIFQRLEEMNVCSYDELMESAANDKFNYSFLEGMEEGDATRLEGFLFPDTYEFYVGMQASSAINKMLETFYYKQTADMLKQASDMNMSMREIVNVASLIEKEAANDAERALIASVIYNRIYAGMQLGIDASVLYEYPDHEGAPTAEMLQTDSPYNTRIRTGLPPTPICNPGMASITAALNPESTGYYYYALDTATGEHRFFTNETEFNNFVATQDYS